MMRTVVLRISLVASVVIAIALMVATTGTAEANGCLDCKQDCRNGGNDCKKAGPKGACKMFRPICTMFKNAQCPAAEKICLKTRCGTMPDCDPNPLPGGLSGDPHFRSLDRARFDYQGVGEYVIARSAKAGIEIQARFEAWGNSVSIATVLAIKAGGHTITFRKGDSAPSVDNRETVLVAAGVPIAKDVMLSPTTDGRVLITVGMTELWVHASGSALSIYMAPAADSKQTWEGLLGNFDGNAKNDFAIRGGETLDVTAVTPEVLHQQWGHSWRLLPEESLLPYGDGESTETFTNVKFPARYVSVASLDSAAFDTAHAICVAKGIGEGDALSDCIYDVGVTGDEAFADALALASKVRSAFSFSFSGRLHMRVQKTAYQGQEIPFYFSLPDGKGGSLSILGSGGRAISKRNLRGTSPAMVTMPAEPGDYLLELRHGETIAKQNVMVTAATATLEAPKAVGGATEFEVNWQGPGGKGDYVAFADAGESNPNKYRRYAWAAKRNKTTFQAPATPGTYQLWYVLAGARDRTVIAKRSIVVGDAHATIAASPGPRVGEHVIITWTGPGGRSDYVDLVAKGETETRGHLSYGWTSSNYSKDPKVHQTRLVAPVDAGEYKLRYIATTVHGREVIAEKPIVIASAEASIQAPPGSVAAKAKFEISYQGPVAAYGYVDIAKRGEQDPKKHESYRWLHKSMRSEMTAPAKAGSYDLRYVIRGPLGERIVARTPLEVKGN